MLLLRNDENEKKLILSETAYQSLNNEQLDFLHERASLVRLNIPIIETIGGGSARCMLAEVFFCRIVMG